MSKRNVEQNRTPKISIAEIRALREGGFTVQEVADKAGIPRTTMGDWLRDWDIQPEEPVLQKSRLTEEWAETLTRMYWEEEKSINDIATELGLGNSRVHDNLRRLGIPLRTRKEAINLAFKKDPKKRERAWMNGRDWDTSKAVQASIDARRRRAKSRDKTRKRRERLRAEATLSETQ